MKRNFFISLFAMVVIVLGAAALASAGDKQWFAHYNEHGKLTCDKGNNGVYGPFATKDACIAYIHSGGDGTPPPLPTGWPGTTGTLDGNASGGCDGADVILTSDETPPGYGAFNFDITPGTTFANLGLDFNFDVLSGTQAQSEPYFIVRFTDHTQAFVYSVDVNPGEPGQQVFSLTGNTYVTREEAMNAWGTKVVDSVTLAVDNGDLSIAAHGLANDACVTPITPGTFKQVDRLEACASKPILRVGDNTMGIYADLDEDTFNSGIFQGTTFTAALYVQGVGLTCDVPAGYTFTGQKVDSLDSPGNGGSIYPEYAKA